MICGHCCEVPARSSHPKHAQERLKLARLPDVARAVQALRPASVSLRCGLEPLWEAAGDVLAALLDDERGAEVTDGEIFRQHAAHYEREFLEDMRTLGVREAHVLTRVSEYIPAIVRYVEGIVNRGLAYACNGSVYFDTRAFREQGHTYGKLAPHAVESADLAAEGEVIYTCVHFLFWAGLLVLQNCLHY